MQSRTGQDTQRNPKMNYILIVKVFDILFELKVSGNSAFANFFALDIQRHLHLKKLVPLNPPDVNDRYDKTLVNVV